MSNKKEKLKELTPRQNEILKSIKRTLAKRGFAPSIREIGEAVGLSSSSTVHSHLRTLEKKGFIRYNHSKPRTIELLLQKNVIYLPVIEEKALKNIDQINQDILETFAIQSDFLDSEEAFLVKVKSLSLKDIGILPGDYVVLKKQNQAKDNDLVAAQVGSEILLRRYIKTSDHIRLEAENRLFKPVFIKRIKTIGIIQGVIRKIEKVNGQ